jgi:hypothetical protein
VNGRTSQNGKSKYVPVSRAAPAIVLMSVCLLITLLAMELGVVSLKGADVADLRARSALLQTLGISSLAVSSECTASRSLVEGLCGCLGDVPGGYCYHTSCDIVGAPQAQEEDLYAMEISG